METDRRRDTVVDGDNPAAHIWKHAGDEVDEETNIEAVLSPVSFTGTLRGTKSFSCCLIVNHLLLYSCIHF